MRAVVQRVSRAQVEIDGNTVGSIGKGLVILLGVGHEDTEEQAERLWSKISRLRIFEDEDGKTNLSLADVHGDVLVVSQFTLFANCKKGNRPSFTQAGAPDEANRLYEWFVERARRDVPRVETGRFGAYMDVSLTNDGPFTLWLDTDAL
ncbi:D-aminoacyl-tRNA deacylase [Paraeggerthella hongkongensis]|uniref:D-aminoacyl-tRNA deacylase n=1 Tax=Paraeggerthella hongkongensis TaxID=230658 RepID=A0A3N0BLN6_9ACTN|nr:D-aminoacyl-tRNA deacylase [Paraeggerthella hongkongensis]RNL49071.1 D-tyrosyl-tRNA(Tyr) deacylase [Paraeggerthella hongkongensis]